MTPATQSYPDQEHQATEIRLTLERAFATLAELDLLTSTAKGTWEYQDDRHTLCYDPQSDRLSFVTNDGSWQLNWHEQAFLPDVSSPITEEHLQEFKELKDWLDQQSVPKTVSLTETYLQIAQEEQIAWVNQREWATTIQPIAAELFEYYATQGEFAYRPAPDSPECTYRVEVDGMDYLLSRNDVIGQYNLRREGTTLDLQTHQGMTHTDLETWQAIGTWLSEQPSLPVKVAAIDWGDTYWDEQQGMAEQILTTVNRLMTPPASNSIAYGHYTINYQADLDTLQVRRDSDIILSATHYLHHDYHDADRWDLSQLSDLGNITTEDVIHFRSLSIWLDARGREVPTALEKVTGRSLQPSQANPLKSTTSEIHEEVQTWVPVPEKSQAKSFELD